MKYFAFLLMCFINLNAQNHTFPVELIYFKAIASNGFVLLSWGTATEVNNYGFYVERSNISLIFNEIGFVPGNGNSNSPKNYVFIDSTLFHEGKYFYRLKQIDIDGHFQFSDTIMVDYHLTGIKENRDKNEITFNDVFEKGSYVIRISNKNSVSGNLFLYSIIGEKKFEAYIESDNSTIIIPNNCSSGIYILVFTVNSKIIQMKKIVIVK
ncbi:MAG: hypothetical protein QHH13_06120 [Melioribacter sp.]|uniref:hypothetical protein n=1 Tax=Rosettibacter primus TaxID=3111523 RepID=UPI00247D4391|nr:hypothetical protein [Melioribacter sp.]